MAEDEIIQYVGSYSCEEHSVLLLTVGLICSYFLTVALIIECECKKHFSLEQKVDVHCILLVRFGNYLSVVAHTKNI